MPGYQFSVFLVGGWEDTSSRYPHHNPQDAAKDYALSIARRISVERLLTETSAVEARINSLLGLPICLRNISVRILWSRAQVSADPLQQKAIVEQLQREHNSALQEQADRRRLQRARDLRNALLSDPSIAIAQWFLDHPEAAEEKAIQRVERLAEAVTAYAPDTNWVKVAKILQDFVRSLPQDSRRHLIETLMGICDRYGYPEHSKLLQSEVLDTMASQGIHKDNID